jgi:hypothetical protein
MEARTGLDEGAEKGLQVMGTNARDDRPAKGRATAALIAACAVALGMGWTATGAQAAGPECPNEQLRSESNLNQVTGRPYSQDLPECRAYEMVSPLYKQSHDASIPSEAGLAVSPNGETVGYGSQGDFAGTENYRVNIKPKNPYIAQRGASEWVSRSAFAPRTLVDSPAIPGLDGDFSPDLRTNHASCGANEVIEGTIYGTLLACAYQENGGPWRSTPEFPTINGEPVQTPLEYVGGSEDLSRMFLANVASSPLLAPNGCTTCVGGIYEVSGTEHAEPRLVSVDNKGGLLANGQLLSHKPFQEEPLLGDSRAGPKVEGSDYHAISSDGKTVFFGATPTKTQLPATKQVTEGEVPSLYARVPCEGGASCTFVERGGEQVEGRETIEVSDPSASECSACNQEATPQEAVFQAASANGEKVFFTTERQLLSGEDSTRNLYEYDFGNPSGKKLVLISKALSPGTEGAEVQGVVKSSSDGSHVYFVAKGVLASENNSLGEGPKPGLENLYAYDTLDGTLKFVATLQAVEEEKALWGEFGGQPYDDTGVREAQTTPDGRYLVFSSLVAMAGDTNPNAKAVYRYDFQTGELVWISQAAPALKAQLKASSPNERDNARVQPLEHSTAGSLANVEDWNRSISDNGEYVIFTTAERLQADDTDGRTDVYLWHNGTVSAISAGGSNQAAMSASGADIIFLAPTRLVGQDTDELEDVYDARIGGGYPAPRTTQSCTGERCQGPQSGLPAFEMASSSLTPAEGNLSPAAQAAPSVQASAPVTAKPRAKKPTNAQRLASALKTCRRKPKRTRAACESVARRRYGANKHAKRSAR